MEQLYRITLHQIDRLKEKGDRSTDGIERVKHNPSRFNFIADADRTVDGFLAHEVSDIVPEAVTGEKDGMRDEEYEVTPAIYEDDGYSCRFG